jgi:DNA polymerase
MYKSWDELRAACTKCKKCELCSTRTNLVFGVGNENAEVLFIGEGPGEQEDLKGEPFVGRAGSFSINTLMRLTLKGAKMYILRT